MSAALANRPRARQWRAGLTLGFENRHGRTVRAHSKRYGPLSVQRGFYPEGKDCYHSYLLHPPGGLVNGDELVIDITVAEQAHALITTPSSGKFYRSLGTQASQQQSLKLAAGAALEWLPQDNIVFDGAIAALNTDIELSSNCRFLGWEISCLGRQAGAQPYLNGRFCQRLNVHRDGKPVLIENGVVTGANDPNSLFNAAWGWRGRAVSGQLIATLSVCDESLLQALRALPTGPEGELGVSHVDGLLLLRFLGHSAEQAKQLFESAWALLRPAVIGKAAVRPRIWNT